MGPILNVGQPVVDPQVTFTPEELSKSMQKYRKELILMPMFAMAAALQHMGHRDGIRYKEHIHEMNGNFQMAAIYNEKKDKRGEKLAETEEDRLEARTDGSDAFDTLCIGVEKFIPDYALQPSTGFTSYFGG